MKEYHKIHSVYKRDESGRFTPEWAREEIGYLSQNEWIWTEKVDGTNIRITIDNGLLRIGGRTDNASIPSFLLDSIHKLLSVEAFKSAFPDVKNYGNVSLYGEGYGNKIQKVGSQYRSDTSFVLFDVLVGEWWLKRTDVENIAAKLGIECVPVVGRGTIFEAIEFVKKEFPSKWGSAMSEGIVLTPSIALLDRGGDRVITKLKYRDFK